jgi:hypothetical protein
MVVERSAAAMVLGVFGEVDTLTADQLKAAVVRTLAQRPVLAEVFRPEWPGAGFTGFLGDFGKAEEAAQKALAIAAERWPAWPMPVNPQCLAGGAGLQPGD